MRRNVFYSLLLFSFCASTFVGCSRDPNVRKRKYLESGRRYFEKQKYQEALIQFSNAIQVDSHYGDAHYRRAQVYLKLQQWIPAYQELTRTVELQPDNSFARLDLANLLIAGHQLEAAREQTDWLLKNAPDNPQVHVAVSDLSAAENNFPAAIQEMQKAVGLETPGQWESYLMLASLQMKANRPDAAEPNFQRAIELNPNAAEPRLALARYYEFRNRLPESERQVKAAVAADPKNTEARTALVHVLMIQGKKNEAELSLKDARREFPDNSPGYRMLGDFYFAAGDVDKAVAEYSLIYRDHPTDMLAKKNYVQLLILQNRLDEAGKIDDEILRASPTDVRALTYRGQLQLRGGKTKEAIKTLQAAVRSDPNNALAYYHLGVVFDREGDFGQAENAWQNAVRLNPDLSEGYAALAKCALRHNDMPALEQSSNQIIRLLPDSPGGYAMRALSLLNRGRFSGAEQDALKAITLGPHAPDGYMQMGNLRLAQRRYPEAEKYFEQTLERDPHSSDALASLMNTYLAQGQPEKALAAIQAQIAKVPDNSTFYDLLGTAQFDHRKTAKDLKAAELDFRKSVQLDKNDADAWLKLAQVLAARGAVDEAIATAQQALQDNPKQVPFYLLMGRLYESKKNFDDARQCYQLALEIDPKSPQASNNMASLLTRTGGNLDVALSLAQNARQKMPDSPNVADTLGWVLYQKGAYRSAIDSFREALELAEKGRSPDDPTVHFHLGMAYQRNGQPLLARHHLEQVLKIDPNYSDAENVKKLLGQLRG